MKIMKRMMMVFFAIFLCTSLVFFACGGGSSDKDDDDDGDEEVDTGDLPEENWWASWDWSTADDSKPNEDVTLELPKPPYKVAGSATFPQGNWGGTSTISGVPDEEDETIQRPTEVKVEGPDGKEVTAFQFTGVVQVSKDSRAWNEGAQYPQVGWEAVPDEETLAALQSAVSYSFWIFVNSAEVKRNPTANAVKSWVFKTVVGASGFASNQGQEFKTYFGNYAPGGAGDNAQPAAYKKLEIGKWNKITVYLDPASDTFNMGQDSHIPLYNQKYLADFDPTTATKIQWQIALQDQSGIGQREGDTLHYDIPRGEFTYDVLFYGFELQLP